MKQVHTSMEIEIDRPVADVWAVVSDYASDARWRAGITEMTPDVEGAPVVGTKVHEVLHLGGRDFVTDTEVTSVGPGPRYRFAGEGTSGGVRGGRQVRRGTTEASSVFTYDIDLEPRDIPTLAQPVVTWWLRHSLRKDLRRLRTLVEAA